VHRVADVTIHKVGQVPETRLRSCAPRQSATVRDLDGKRPFRHLTQLRVWPVVQDQQLRLRVKMDAYRIGDDASDLLPCHIAPPT